MESRVYRSYLLGICTLTITFSFSDRLIMGVILQGIKHELSMSDTQLGLVSGLAIAIFYSLAGIPMGRWADRGNRPVIASISLAIWGATMMLSSFVVNSAQLVFARMGTAVGESGGMPATYSLIGDHFKGRSLTRAMAIYMSAPNLAPLLVLPLGGYLNEVYGWRSTLFAFSVPGLVLAALLKYTVRETRSATARYTAKTPTYDTRSTRDLASALRALWRNKPFRLMLIALVSWNTYWSAFWTWTPSSLIRDQILSSSEVGLWLGIAGSGAGALSTILGGYLFDRLWRDDTAQQARAAAFLVLFVVAINVLFHLSGDKDLAIFALVILSLCSSSFIGPMFSIGQNVVPPEMRATSMSMILLFMSLIGLGVGPTSVGFVSDLSESYVGQNSLRIALIGLSVPAFLISAICFWLLAKALSQQTAAVSSRDDLTSPTKIVVTN